MEGCGITLRRYLSMSYDSMNLHQEIGRHRNERYGHQDNSLPPPSVLLCKYLLFGLIPCVGLIYAKAGQVSYRSSNECRSDVAQNFVVLWG